MDTEDELRQWANQRSRGTTAGNAALVVLARLEKLRKENDQLQLHLQEMARLSANAGFIGLAEADRIRAAIERVRDLHFATEPGEWICEACANEWPCPTIRALDVQPPAPADRCPSCEHGREYHSEPGCWYAVTVGAPGKPLNCPCAIVDWPSK